MNQEQKLDEALEETFPASDAFSIAPIPTWSLGAPMRARVLIVDTDWAAPLLAKLLGDAFDTSTATTWDDAVRLLQEKKPWIVLVGYHFDETRPYRFIHYLRGQAPSAELPVLLVRGLAVQHGPYVDKAIGESYQTFGASGYLALDKTSTGARALEEAQRLRKMVGELLGKGRSDTH